MINKVRIRMYRQGLGDCFLLSFGNDEYFSDAAHVLIDCGTLGATDTKVKLTEVVEDIAEATRAQLSALVATHEHADHVSGFNSQRTKFDKITVQESWLAWTEDPEDPMAQELEKYSGDLKLAALSATQAMALGAITNPITRDTFDATRAVLSFFTGEEPFGASLSESGDKAMKYVASRAGEKSQYLEVGTHIQPPWLPGVTVYVLGPPHNMEQIKNLGEHGDSELYEISDRYLRGFNAGSKQFVSKGSKEIAAEPPMDPLEKDELDLSYPFDSKFRCVPQPSDPEMVSYEEKSNGWRRIDTDWLSSGADLALQLDNLTNNTSLVLAFEIGVDGPVILMAADAQLGSWLSWHDYTWPVKGADGTLRIVKAKDLLARTLVYKVGHHSSHNATAVEHGLEMMTNKSLIALIPIDGKVADSKHWPMPAEKLYRRLLEKTRGRTIRSDTGLPDSALRPKTVPEANWGKLPPRVTIEESHIYFDTVITL